MKDKEKRECPDCLQSNSQKIPCDTCDGLGIIKFTSPVFAVLGQKTALRIIQENT